MSAENREIEIKLRAPNPETATELLLTNGFSVTRARVHEINVLFDTPELRLRESGQLLRIREDGERALLTFKDKAIPGRHKSREELELEISSARTLEHILARLGFEGGFRYEKYRTEFGREGDAGVVTIDETPIGTFLELEGAPEWIDETAASLGFREEDYVTASYGRLYLDWCVAEGRLPGTMTWTDGSA